VVFETAPDRVNVAVEPVTRPEMLYVAEAAPVKLTPVTTAPFTDTALDGGVKLYPDRLAVTTYDPFASPVKV
jgi:hypothetical protein